MKAVVSIENGNCHDHLALRLSNSFVLGWLIVIKPVFQKSDVVGQQLIKQEKLFCEVREGQTKS